MSARAATDCWVYDCPVCGPCLAIDDEDDEEAGIILHNDVPHPLDMTFDEEDNPQ